MKTRAMVRVRGLVQGVNFRHHTHATATTLGVVGWVRNLPDGSVEGCFEGEEHAVKALIEWCHQGPAWARVDGVEVVQQAFQNEFVEFTIRRS